MKLKLDFSETKISNLVMKTKISKYSSQHHVEQIVSDRKIFNLWTVINIRIYYITQM